jgi:hypothetical protein
MSATYREILVAAVLLTIAVPSFAAEPAHVPATPQAAANADLIARADRALRDYVVACSIGDDEAIARVVTSEAVFEYDLAEPGTHIAVEATALGANCVGDAKRAASPAHISNLWIFPTNDSNAVFVQYTTRTGVRSPASDFEHLALLEMQGSQIVRMHEFRADTGNLSTLETSVVAGASRFCRDSAHD